MLQDALGDQAVAVVAVFAAAGALHFLLVHDLRGVCSAPGGPLVLQIGAIDRAVFASSVGVHGYSDKSGREQVLQLIKSNGSCYFVLLVARAHNSLWRKYGMRAQ